MEVAHDAPPIQNPAETTMHYHSENHLSRATIEFDRDMRVASFYINHEDFEFPYIELPEPTILSDTENRIKMLIGHFQSEDADKFEMELDEICRYVLDYIEQKIPKIEGESTKRTGHGVELIEIIPDGYNVLNSLMFDGSKCVLHKILPPREDFPRVNIPPPLMAMFDF